MKWPWDKKYDVLTNKIIELEKQLYRNEWPVWEIEISELRETISRLYKHIKYPIGDVVLEGSGIPLRNKTKDADEHIDMIKKMIIEANNDLRKAKPASKRVPKSGSGSRKAKRISIPKRTTRKD